MPLCQRMYDTQWKLQWMQKMKTVRVKKARQPDIPSFSFSNIHKQSELSTRVSKKNKGDLQTFFVLQVFSFCGNFWQPRRPCASSRKKLTLTLLKHMFYTTLPCTHKMMIYVMWQVRHVQITLLMFAYYISSLQIAFLLLKYLLHHDSFTPFSTTIPSLN